MNAEAWMVARFGSVRLDRRRRELWRDGALQPMPPRAFDVLVALIDRRHRVVSKDDLIAQCWNGEAGNDGALARTVMNVRRCIGDIGQNSEVIGTVRGAGYRFDGEVDLSSVGEPSTAAKEAVAPATRLALLPLVNDTGDAGLAWIELGLASMLGKSLASSRGIAVVALHEVLAALSGLPTDAPLARRVSAVRRHLDPQVVVAARMGGGAGRLVLRFDLLDTAGDVRTGSVTGADASALALQASNQLVQWLLPNASAHEVDALDLGDPLANETFARALQKSREGRLIEAAHLLDVVTDSGVEHPEVQHELAKVHVALGAPRAKAEIEALRRAAVRAGNPEWQASAGLLSSTLAWQHGNLRDAGSAAAEAAAVAESAGLAELSLRCLIDSARHYGQCFDPRAEAMLSRAIPQAERLGNRVLMRHAYHTAGLLCGFRNDWIGALRYQETALQIADTMAEATRGTALFSVAWTFIQLGRLEEGCDIGLKAFRCARISGSQPELGEAARVAAYGCIHARRVLEAATLFGELQEFDGHHTTSMLIARDVLLRAGFLSLNGRIDEALAWIAATRDNCGGHPVYQTYCDIAESRLLLNAGRFDQLLALCTRLRGSEWITARPRLEAWVERAEALADHLAFGRTEQAIARLGRAVARLAQCEPQARMALDLCWLHLERGNPELAEPLLVPLQSWIEQSAPGILVHARLQYEHGRFEAAAIEQRRFVELYGATLTPFTGSLLDVYEQAARNGRRKPIAPMNQPLNLHYGLAPSVVQQLPVELGGQ